MRTLLWSTQNGDIPANLAFTNNFAATTNPTAANDSSQGYSAGSVWINATADSSWICSDASEGAAVWLQQGAPGEANAQFTAPAATTPTGLGGDAKLIGGPGGSTSGDGGEAFLTGGAASAGNSNGGDAVLTPGAGNGTGKSGVIRHAGLDVILQGAPAAKTVSATLTAAEVLTGIITVNQGAGAASAQQLPIAADLDAALPTVGAGYAFDFSVINTSTVDAEDASVTTNTGWTLVGEMDVQAHSALAAQGASGRFRARKTGTAAWTLYRLS